MFRRILGSSLVAAAVGLVASPAQAVLTSWTVQSSSSSLSISGALSSGGSFLASVTQQGAGGLTTKYTGTVNTQQTVVPVATDGWAGTPIDIEFLSASLSALNSGNWDPLPGGSIGLAAANYGAQVSLGFLGGANLAIRGLSAGLASGVTALSGTAYGVQTANPNLTVTLLSATADYRGFGPVGGALGSGSLTSGIAGQTGAYTATGSSIAYSGGGQAGTATLTIPVNFSISLVVVGQDTTDPGDDIGVYLALNGQIAATAATSEVPEANSLVLLGLAGSAVGFVGYRRRMKNS